MSRHEAVLEKAIRTKVFIGSHSTYIHSPDFKEQAWIFDFRAAILLPEVLNAYAECFLDTYKDRAPFQVGGLEVAAIPLVAAIVMKSQERGTPISGFFIRKSRKKTGLLKQIEGELKNLPVVLVDDLVNSGGSFLKQVAILEKLRGEEPGLKDLKVMSVHAILRFRDQPAYVELTNKDIAIESVFSLDDFSDLSVKNLPAQKAEDNVTSYEVLWRWQGGKPALEHVVPKAGLSESKDEIFVITDTGIVTCLHKDTGQEVWSYKVAGAQRRGQFSTPVYFEDTVYFGATDGNVYALDAKTGKRRWVSFEGDWVSGSICLAPKQKLLYVAVETGLFRKHSTLYALKTSSGEVCWSVRLPGPALASVITNDRFNSIVVCTTAGDILILNPKTGKEVRRHSLAPYEIHATPSLSSDSSKLFIACLGSRTTENDDSAIYRYDFKSGVMQEFFTDFSFGIYSGMVITKEGYLIAPALDKHIYALQINDGSVAWKLDTESRNFASPLYAKTALGQKLFVGTNGGLCLEIEPGTGKITGSIYVVERITNPPLYDKTREALFIHNYANEIYRIKRLPG